MVMMDPVGPQSERGFGAVNMLDVDVAVSSFVTKE
jgi:hypothetical protein